MLAFAFEQVGDAASAEEHGRLGTSLVPDDAWSHHAVGHALYNQASSSAVDWTIIHIVHNIFFHLNAQARLAEGFIWLSSHARTWTDLCSFMVTHNHFHIALNLLDMG